MAVPVFAAGDQNTFIGLRGGNYAGFENFLANAPASSGLIASYDPQDLISKLKQSTNFDEEKYILNSAIRVAANVNFQSEIQRSLASLDSVLTYAEGRAKYAAFAIEGATGVRQTGGVDYVDQPGFVSTSLTQPLNRRPTGSLSLPPSYKKALVIKAYFDAFQEGLLIWNFTYPYIVPILENGNFMTNNPKFRPGSLPNPLQLNIPRV